MTVVYQIIGSKSKILNSFLALYHTREESGLTQADLAERANVPQSTIARIERGDNVTFDKLAEIAHAMGKTIKIEFTQ
ncbi:helix-turn-helix domain-containing protein [Lactiplantibacillus plantarum]|uniref:helix-turn-helix domain-containing protein n=1 Tax=Lactiplantibacillus plantarum TaxID=1590 RepID=UPI003C1EAE7F